MKVHDKREEGPMDFHNYLSSVDHVPQILLDLGMHRAILYILDNGAVIKMLIEGRLPALRHVARKHRIHLDKLFEQIQNDPVVFIRYVDTRMQA